MTMARGWGLLLVSAFVAGCGDDTGPGDTGADIDVDGGPDADDGGPDEAGPDVEATDGDDDAGDMTEAEADVPPEESYCRPCRWNDECGTGGAVCAAFDGLEMSCLPPCLVAGDCPSGAECLARAGGRCCTPVAGTCIVSRLGDACRAWGCEGRYDSCSDPAGSSAGFCTRTCAGPVDCEPGYNVCGDRGDGVFVCLPPPPAPPERCGGEPPATGVGASCAGGAACGGGADTCLRSVDSRLPELCSTACVAPGDCPAGSRCLPVAGTSPTDLERYCLPDDCSCWQRVPGSMLDDALDALGLGRCELLYSPETLEWFGDELAHDRFRLPWFDDVHNEWLRGEPFVRETVAALDEMPTPRGLLRKAAALQGHPVLDRPFEPTLEPADPLTGAVAALVEHHGGTADRAAIRTAFDSLPADLRAALAPVVAALDAAATARDAALARIADSATLVRQYFVNLAGFVLPSASTLSLTDRRVQDFLLGDFDYGAMFQAAHDLLVAVEAADLGRFRDAMGFAATFDTPRGRIVVRDGAATEHATAEHPGDLLLVLDTGGDDTYRIPAGATRSATNPVSLLIDLGGADLYGYDERSGPRDVPPRLPSDEDGRYAGDGSYGPFSLSTRGRQGSGTLGIGILLDRGASGDEYRSLRMSQGWGALGVGILHDEGGDDRYLCEAGCQGAAVFGLGLLVDDGDGIDHYEGYHAVQGFAYSQAVSVLYEAGGNDSYLAQPDDVLYYSPQDPGGSNSSMSQGAGYGRRSDVAYGGDGVYLSGGLGILRDRAGNDDYECAIFGQGTGYWFGMGLLADGDGNDRYDARWYVQGGAAHYAMAALWDASGDDVYNADARRMNVTLGGGHDFSNAFLLDDAGDDVYGAPNLSLGAGNEDGFGLFVDGGGVDAYQCSSDFSFGNAYVDPASGRRTTVPTMGLFLDADGVDTYVRPDTTRTTNDALWTQRMHPTAPVMEWEWGAGVDRSAGVTGL
ncbi:MAG: hypothetical protein JXB32_04345 [Deltaproteobacteria bacterium]|nr:hypothetical protein [Deltaproteobacteria bacterium]